MELIIHFRLDNSGDARLDLSVQDMSEAEVLTALGLTIIELKKQFDIEIDAELIEEVIRVIKDEQR